MGKKKTTFIEINGRRYDAETGESVDGGEEKSPMQRQSTVKSAATKTTLPVHHGTVMDIRAPRHTAHHKQERSKTLMRTTVKKPAPSTKRQVHAVTRTDILAKSPAFSLTPKWSVAQIDPKRLRRAERVAKSQLIRKFAPLDSIAITGGEAAISLPVHHHEPVTPVASPSTAAPVHTNRSMDIFQRALVHADAHEQKPVKLKKHAKATATHKKRRSLRHHTITVASSALAVVLLAGFIAYQNKANLNLRMASAASGIQASLPGYRPSGYAVGKFSYHPGVVAINFHNDAANRSYDITQQKSNWDSQTLLDSYVSPKSHAYQTLQSGGRTIYIYGENNATWVDNGIWYQITDNGNLSTSDVLSVASSM